MSDQEKNPVEKTSPKAEKAKKAPKKKKAAASDNVMVDQLKKHVEVLQNELAQAKEHLGELFDAGVYAKGVNIIRDNRPFADLQAFASTRGIGAKTVEAVRDHTK